MKKEILIEAYDYLQNDVNVGDEIPTFSWFCELVEDENHILYKNYVKPIYIQELRKKKIKRLI